MILKEVKDRLILVVLSVVILAITFPEIYLPNDWWYGTGWQVFLTYAGYGLGLIMLTLLLVWVLRHYKVRVFDREHFRWCYLIYVAVGYVVMVSVDYLSLLWLNHIGEATTANEAALMEEAAQIPLVLTVIGSVLFGPITEEVVCRSLLNKLFFKHWRFLGILVSSLLFGAMHGPTNLPSWVIYAGSGLIFATVYELTDDLAYPIALHILNNGIASFLA